MSTKCSMLQSGPLGGDQQIGAKIVSNDLRAIDIPFPKKVRDAMVD